MGRAKAGTGRRNRREYSGVDYYDEDDEQYEGQEEEAGHYDDDSAPPVRVVRMAKNEPGRGGSKAKNHW